MERILEEHRLNHFLSIIGGGKTEEFRSIITAPGQKAGALLYLWQRVSRKKDWGSNFAINLVSFDAADVLFKQYLLFSSSFMACCVIDAAILGIGNNLI